MRMLMRMVLPCIGVVSVAMCIGAHAHEYIQGGLTIGHPWARPTAENARNGAAYLSVKNSGKDADRLVSAKSPAADATELHEIIRDGDVLRMREMAQGIAIAPKQTVTLEPGGYHVMLLGLKQRLEIGKSIPVTLAFEKAGLIEVEVKIEKAPEHESSKNGAEAHSHHKH